MIKNIIFDYGSVLIKTDPRRVYAPLFGSWEKADWFRNNILEQEWIRRVDSGEDYRGCIADLQAKFPDYADAIELYDTRFTDFLVGEMPGMSRLLARLRAEGFHLYGLTNFSHKLYYFQQHLPIFRHIEGQVVSSEVHLLKPDVRIYRLLLAKYGLRAEECLFVDDRQENVDAARALGIGGLLFPQVAFTKEQILNGISLEYSDNTVPPEIELWWGNYVQNSCSPV